MATAHITIRPELKKTKPSGKYSVWVILDKNNKVVDAEHICYETNMYHASSIAKYAALAAARAVQITGVPVTVDEVKVGGYQ